MARSDDSELTVARQWFSQRYSVTTLADRLIETLGHLDPLVMTTDEQFLGHSSWSKLPVLLEGTHGILTHPQFGFTPHVTMTDVGLDSARAFLSRGQTPYDMVRIGVLRAYAYRLGHGPMVTYDEAMTNETPAIHYKGNRWQGRPRIGMFDLVAFRYALRCCGGVDLISLTNVDRLSGRSTVELCNSYEFHGTDSRELDRYFECERSHNRITIRALKPPPAGSAWPEGNVARLLNQCVPGEIISLPCWGEVTHGASPNMLPKELRAFIDLVASSRGLDTPVGFVSYGATTSQKTVFGLADSLLS